VAREAIGETAALNSLALRYLKSNNLPQKTSQKRDFLKLVLDRLSVSVYFADTSVFSADFATQSLTERGAQTMGQEKPSHDDLMTRRMSLVVCIFTRL
jgi:hypothetical protein